VTVLERLEQALAAGRLSHAYLLIGGGQEEKLHTVRQIAAAINCTARQGGRACGQCRSCRQMAGGNHPDYHYLEPRGASIKIDQVRRLEAELYLKAFQGGAQIVVLNQAESLTPEAANCLLKILEEPPGEVYFFLLAVQPALLLPTISSRCQALRFSAEESAGERLH
jgi:DNA polymerase-3 subunit delta'